MGFPQPNIDASKFRLLRRSLLSIGLILLLWEVGTQDKTPVRAQTPTSPSIQADPIFRPGAIFHPVTARQGMVSVEEEYAAQAGLAVLVAGGNAIDAAVTIGFALAVTLPKAGNIGGGGFMLIHLAETREAIALDYREVAPAAATRDMFLDEAGEADTQKSRFSHLAVGVPGTVAGLAFALDRYGTITLAEALAPAIQLAEDGFPVDLDLYKSLKFATRSLQAFPASQAEFWQSNGQPYEIGDTLKRPDLANSLKLIAKQGPDAFYRGAIAQAIVQEMEANEGLITAADLANYRSVVRQPVRGTFQGHEILSMPPPSSGGVHLIQMLNVLEPFPLESLGHNSAATIHLMAESMKFAYADRSQFLGDTDFVSVPLAELTSKAYAARLRQRINSDRSTPSRDITPGTDLPLESQDTTHFSVIDHQGNAVANTYTLNFSYGSGITVPGTGILLNNEMDDFAAKPGVPNAFGLIGGEKNAVAPGKRMLSSMAPTIVRKDGQPYLVTGSPGGSRIITSVLQVILNAIAFEQNIAVATNAPRVHHQWLPDQLEVEAGISPDTIALLEQKGHVVKPIRLAIGSTQSIMWRDGWFYGASDPRRPGALTLGY